MLKQEMTNLDYKEIDIIENLYKTHFVEKKDQQQQQKITEDADHNSDAPQDLEP